MGFAGSTAAVDFEQFGDRVCQFNMVSALMPFCALQLESEISSTASDDVQFEIYTDAVVNQDRREQLTKEQRSHLNQTFGMAMARAKLTVIEELNNGSSEGTAQQAALKEISNYYTVQQVKVLSHQEREVYTLNETLNTIAETDGLSRHDVFKNTGDCRIGGSYPVTFNEKIVTLHNNTERNYTSVLLDECFNGGYDADIYYASPVLGAPNQSLSNGVSATVLSGRGDNVTAYSVNTHQKTLQMIDDRKTKAENNVINLTSALYDKYEPGELNTSGSSRLCLP